MSLRETPKPNGLENGPALQSARRMSLKDIPLHHIDYQSFVMGSLYRPIMFGQIYTAPAAYILRDRDGEQILIHQRDPYLQIHFTPNGKSEPARSVRQAEDALILGAQAMLKLQQIAQMDKFAGVPIIGGTNTVMARACQELGFPVVEEVGSLFQWATGEVDPLGDRTFVYFDRDILAGLDSKKIGAMVARRIAQFHEIEERHSKRIALKGMPQVRPEE